MSYKVAIDMCYFYKVHMGGKDEVAYNLLKGFDKIGVSDQVVCFTYKKIADYISEINPNVKVCVVPKIRTGRFLGGFHFCFRNYYEERWVIKNNVPIILFPNKPTIKRRLRITTIEIPHDISIYEDIRASNCTDRQIVKQKKDIVDDFKYRDYIVAISDYDKSTMIKHLPWGKDKITRIYDPIYFGDRVSYGQKKYITALNIQWEHKNVKTLIKAFSRIASKIEYDLILVGRYPETIEELRRLVSEHKLEDRVKFTGFVSNEEMSSIIDKTRIYVNASLFEGFGMTAVEMMGRGVPTIVAENTAQPEVTMGLCKYYSPTEDSVALAEKIMDEINNPTSEKELDRIAEAVRARYSYEVIAKDYWDLIMSILKGGDIQS